MREILGIDLSKHRNDLTRDEFAHLDEKGVRFLFTRITSQFSGADPTAERYLRWANQLGWVTGGYHFLDRTMDVGHDWDGASQAIAYQNAQDDIVAKDIECDLDFIDVEVPVSYMTVLSMAQKMRQLGYDDIGLYTRLSFWEPRFGDRVNPFDFDWLADWRGGRRWLNNWQTQPEDEKYRPGVLWQFGSLRYNFEGKKRNIDGNVFNGTQVQLLELARKVDR